MGKEGEPIKSRKPISPTTKGYLRQSVDNENRSKVLEKRMDAFIEEVAAKIKEQDNERPAT